MKLDKKIGVLLFSASLLSFAGCNKTESAKGADGRGQTIVNVGLPYALKTIDVSTNPQSLALIDLIRNVPNETELNKELVVSMQPDTAALIAYNYENGTKLETLPDSSYNFVSGVIKSGDVYNVKFSPGEFAKALTINLPHTSTLDLTKSYALSFTLLVAVSGADGKVSFDSRSAIVELALKNSFDGVYKVRSYIARFTDLSGSVDPVKTGFPPEFEVSLITAGPNSVIWNQTHYWADNTGVGGIGVPYFTISSNDSIQASSSVPVASPGIPVANVPGYIHWYDRANKKFYVSYGWTATTGLPRFITDTLEFVRPR